MNDEALISLSNRMKSDLFIGFVGSCRSGKSTLINSFFKLLILPNVEDEFMKHKILDELPQTAEGKQIMTVEPKFIPSTSIELNVNSTVMNLRFVDCVGEIIPSAEGFGTDAEPRLVKTPWYNEAIPFQEAASIGTEKVIFNHSNLGIYVTSDGSFSEFTRNEYAEIEEKLIPKLKDMNKPFVIVLNTKDPLDPKAQALAKDLESKYEVNVVCLSALKMTQEDANLVLSKALEEFPISDLEISLPDYIDAIGEDIPLKKSIMDTIQDVEMKYKKVKDVSNICKELRNANQFSDVKLELLEAATGKASIVLDLDDSKYKEIVDLLLGKSSESRKDFISYLYQSKKANEVYEEVNSAILEAKQTGYGVSVPRIADMHLLPPEVVKKNGMYGVKLSAKASCIHMIAVDLESSFTPIIGSEEQSRMLMDSLNSDGDEEALWNKEFFGKKLSDIVNDSMKSKIHGLPDKSKDKIKNVLDKIMNSNHNNLIAIIL
ncbi:MAG: stage IV sporulation protein A [Roseburia sp.]|nr:stage IV sporulation protein A [Anaeroplasma bactoclasticum]MCM1196828.1 stage IV sporulation protein A [Roseburia sp.]MCM1557431.1 stage IV sporulation protein A [Anaeroplasma bactoclasticum]